MRIPRNQVSDFQVMEIPKRSADQVPSMVRKRPMAPSQTHWVHVGKEVLGELIWRLWGAGDQWVLSAGWVKTVSIASLSLGCWRNSSISRMALRV
jgi:hypothetical protein